MQRKAGFPCLSLLHCLRVRSQCVAGPWPPGSRPVVRDNLGCVEHLVGRFGRGKSMLHFTPKPLECLPHRRSPSLVCGSTLIAGATNALVLSRPQWPRRKATKMEATCMNQIELANRWKLSPRTLERWRWLGQGPLPADNQAERAAFAPSFRRAPTGSRQSAGIGASILNETALSA